MTKPTAKNREKVSKSRIDLKHRANLQLDHVQRAMELIVAPGDSELVVSPAPAPSRAGVARYRQTLEFTRETASDRSGFAIHARPDVHAPIAVTTGTAVVANSDPWNFRFNSENDKITSLVGVWGVRELAPESPLFDPTMQVIPVLSAGGTFALNFAMIDTNSPYSFTISAWAIVNNGTAKTLITSQTLQGSSPTAVFASGTWAASWGGIGFSVASSNTSTYFNRTSVFSVDLVPGASQNFSPQIGRAHV